MRRVVGAGAYLPGYSEGGRRVGGRDEDALTFLATALERAGARAPARPRTVTVRLVGAAPEVAPASLGAVLGHPPTSLERAPGTVEALRSALAFARDASGPTWVMVVAEDADAPAGPPGEGAAAVLVDEGTAGVPAEELEHALAGADTPLAALLGARLASWPAWTGDWAVDPGSGRPAPGPRRAPAGAAVSQGALVPGPRDEEGRASRWRFVGELCSDCGQRNFPARGRCARCGSTDRLEPDPLPLDGATVVASTWIGPGGQPTEFDGEVAATGPYGVVLAEVAPGLRVTLAVADASPGEVRIGARVDTRLRRLYPTEGAWRYGRKAVPAVENRSAGGPE